MAVTLIKSQSASLVNSLIASAILILLPFLTCTRPVVASPENVIASNNKFAVKLLKEILSGNSSLNVFVSPASISSALTMVYHGSKGSTKSELSTALGLTGLNEQDVMRDWQSLLKQVMSNLNENYQLAITNVLMVQKDFGVLTKFRELVEQYYLSGIQYIDVSKKTDGLQRINDYVASKTDGKINQTLDQIDPLTKLVVISCVYFKNKWKREFSVSDTVKENFANYGKKNKSVDFMHLKEDFLYGEISSLNARVIEIPFKENRQCLYIIMPKSGNIHQFMKRITSDIIDETEMRMTYVDLGLPKFTLFNKYSLIPYLENLGARRMFKTGADLSAMTGRANLYVSNIVHRTVIAVHEEGIEAFSATASEQESLVAGFDEKEPIEFNVNLPFLYLVRDNTHKITLFIGVVSSL